MSGGKRAGFTFPKTTYEYTDGREFSRSTYLREDQDRLAAIADELRLSFNRAIQGQEAAFMANLIRVVVSLEITGNDASMVVRAEWR